MATSTKLPNIATGVSIEYAAWWNVDYIKADDANEASCFNGNIGMESDLLEGTDYEMDVPEGATIDGIEVAIKWRGQSCDITRIKLKRGDGSMGSTNKSPNTAVPGSATTSTYGGAADLWGQSWAAKASGNTDADNVNSVNFGASIAMRLLNDDPVAGTYVNFIEVTVHYTESGGGGGSTNFRRVPGGMRSGSRTIPD